MAPQSPDPAGWRGSSGSGSAGSQHWRRSAPLASAGRGFRASKLLLRFLALVAVVACGYGIYVLMNWQSATGLRVLLATVSDYQLEKVPLNPFSPEDTAVVNALAGLKHRLQPVSIGPLEKLTEPPPKTTNVKEVLIVAVSLLAARNAGGTYFLMRNADPDAPTAESFLPEQALWDWLAKLEPRQPKLLLLDFARVTTDWRAGWFEPAIWTGIAEQAGKIPGLVVMTSCAPGEQSWSGRELGNGGTSAFLHFTIKGLCGAADRDRDATIKVSELQAYVAANTAQWVVSNRDEKGQHPQLIPEVGQLQARDFPICKVFNSRLEPFSATSTSGSSSGAVEEQVHKLWQLRDALVTKTGGSAPWISGPVQWCVIQSELLNAEGALDAGHLPRAQACIKTATELLNQFQRSAQPADQSMSSFPYLRDNIVRRLESRRTPIGSESAIRVEGEPFRRPEEVLRRHMEGGENWPIPRNLPANLIGQAVALRDLAENAAGPNAFATRWIRDELQRVEQELRILEDSLFTGSPPASTDPRFADLTTRFKNLVDLADAVTEAEANLCRARSELGLLVRWAANRTGNQATRERLLKLAVDAPGAFNLERPDAYLQAWQRESEVVQGPESVEYLVGALSGWVGKLQFLLSEAGRTSLLKNSADSTADVIRAASSRLLELSQSIEAKLVVEATELSRLTPESTLPLHRQRLVDMLRYSGLKAELRRELRQKLREFERLLHERTAPVASAEVVELTSPEQRLASDVFHGRWQTFWILQLPGGLEEFQFKELVDAWTAAGVTDDMSTAFNRLQELGSRLAASWPARKSFVEEQLRRAGDFAQRREALQNSERGAIWLDSREARALLDTAGEPVNLLRAYDRIELALMHAGRLLEGFWSDEGERAGSTPWYRTAADQCLAFADQTARTSGLSITRETTELRALARSRSEANLRVSLAQSEPLRFGTSGNRLPVVAQTSPEGSLPAGTASVWINLGDEKRVVVSTNGLTLTPQKPGMVTFELEKSGSTGPGEDCSELLGETLAFYRGRIWRAPDTLSVEPCRALGRITTYTPTAPVGSVIVKGKDRRPVAIILDCSLSMSYSVNDTTKFVGPDSPESKFQIAVQRLENLLATEFDPEDRVGLILYGHRTKLEGGKVVFNLDWFKKKTGLPDPPPDQKLTDLGRDGWQDQEIVVPVGLYRQTRPLIENVIKDIRETKPYGITPLMNAITLGLSPEMLPPSGGIVLAITDGEASDNTLDISGAISRVPCEVIIVGFGVPEGELERLHKKFEQQPAVQVLDAPDGETLRGQLASALQDRKYTVVRSGGTPIEIPPTELGVPVNGLPPGEYELQFPDFPSILFHVVGGERYEFNLDYVPGRQLVLQTPNYRQRSTVADASRAEVDDPLYLAYESYSTDQNGNPTLIVVLDRERTLSGNNPVRLARRPEQVQFEVSPLGSQWEGNLDWSLMPDRPVPSWKLVLHDFPQRFPAQVKGWWRRHRLPPGALVPWTNLAPSTPERPVSVELPGGQTKYIAYATRPIPTTIQLAVAFPPGTPLSADQIADLGQLEVQLGQVDGVGAFIPFDFKYRRDFGAADGSLVVEFDITGQAVDRLTVGFTAAKAIREGSLTAPPITIDRLDSLGNAP